MARRLKLFEMLMLTLVEDTINRFRPQHHFHVQIYISAKQSIRQVWLVVVLANVQPDEDVLMMLFRAYIEEVDDGVEDVYVLFGAYLEDNVIWC